MDLDDEERTAKFIQQQIERANSAQKEVQIAEATELKRESEEEKVTFALGGTMKKAEEKEKTKYVYIKNLFVSFRYRSDVC